MERVQPIDIKKKWEVILKSKIKTVSQYFNAEIWEEDYPIVIKQMYIN